MKKILAAAVAFLFFTTATMAQAVKKTEVKTSETKMKIVPAKPVVKPMVKVVPVTKTTTKTVVVVKPTVTKTTTVVMKKDGTPDKRYSNASKSTGPVKKDGTPDMRYKKNKTN